MSTESDVKFGEWIDRGFTLYKENLGVLILAGCLAFLLSFISLGILCGPMMIGLILITLRLLDGGEPVPAPTDIFQGFSRFLDSFIFYVVLAFASIIVNSVLAFIPCVGSIAGIFATYALMALVMFAPFLIADAGKAFVPACEESIAVVKPQFWPLMGLNIVAGLLGSLGFILCGVGVIITFPLSVCILAIAYRELFSGDTGDVVVEPVADDTNADTSAESQAAVEEPAVEESTEEEPEN